MRHNALLDELIVGFVSFNGGKIARARAVIHAGGIKVTSLACEARLKFQQSCKAKRFNVRFPINGGAREV